LAEVKSYGFQRYDQEERKGDSGPPWIRYASGYFREALKLEGLNTQPKEIRFIFIILTLYRVACIFEFENLRFTQFELTHIIELDQLL
jgi:hypothetical protein